MFLDAIPTTGLINTARAIAQRGAVSRAGIAAPTGVIKANPQIFTALKTMTATKAALVPVPQVRPQAPIQANPDIYAAINAALTNKANPNWQADAAEDRVVIRATPDAAPGSPSWLIPALIAAGLVLVYLARRKG